ncbi:acyltransferase [Variovorax sp. J22P271]|uniref:acyltransferase family protein n=1 Tax=Variovorax davisae TaxID=3053515 RepID=UPI002575EDFE|nr:acyltransferase [Variovorax sp. J22P271]MDM0031484.1 acyltransferase [Variovorax sp. J22P271]
MYELDLLRFFAASMVAIFHLTTHYADLDEAIPFGWVGVQIFFVLSGFVIANSSENVGAGRFLKSRVLRLYPAAMITTVIGAALLWTGTGGPGVGRVAVENSFFIRPVGPWIARSYWTLPIEMFFYLLVFALIRLNIHNRLERLAIFLSFLSIPYNVYLLGGELAWWDDPGLIWNYGPINIPLIRHGQFFALGIFIWLASRNGGKMNHRFLFVLAAAMSAVEIWLTASFETAPARGNDLTTSTLYLEALGVWVLAVVFLYCSAVGVIRIPARQGAGRRPSLRSLLRTLGLATYPLYLVHESFAARIIPFLRDRGGLPDSLSVAGSYVATVIASVVIVKFMEARLKTLMSALIDRLVALARRLPPAAPRAERNDSRWRGL